MAHRREPNTDPAPEPSLERPPCPLCGEVSARPVYPFPPYAVVRCDRCAFWYLHPRLSESAMRDAYAEDSYFEGGGLGYSSYLAQEPTLRLTFRRFLRELSRRGIAGGRLLEIGCAYGFFLDECRNAFSVRLGTDYSAVAVAHARRRGLEVIHGGLESLPGGEPFDCAAAIHVIEHIYDPRRFVTDLLQHVRPGGWVLLATPDMGGFWRHALGRRWPFFKVPEHVTFFEARSLRQLLSAVGCTEVQSLPYASVFSLAMVGEKVRWTIPAGLRELRLWLPGTTIAAAGRKPVDPLQPKVD